MSLAKRRRIFQIRLETAIHEIHAALLIQLTAYMYEDVTKVL